MTLGLKRTFLLYGKIPNVRLSEKNAIVGSKLHFWEEGFVGVVLEGTSTLIMRGNCCPKFSEPEETWLFEE